MIFAVNDNLRTAKFCLHIYVRIKIFAVIDNLTNAKLSVDIYVPIKFFAVNDNPTSAKCCVSSVILLNHTKYGLSRKIFILSAYLNILSNMTQSACSSSWLNEPRIYMCSLLLSQHACVASWLKERGIYTCSMLVSFCGLKNVAYTRVAKHFHIIRIFEAPVPLHG